MDFAEQLRVLETAKGDPARLALATVDLVHGSLLEEQRATLKKALQSAAVPHWIDQSILATLLSGDESEAAEVLAQLRTLNVVEPFPARGERAANVHEATRKALRKMLQGEELDLFRSLSARARTCFVADSAFHMRLEALYHLFAADQEAAAVECAELDNEASLLGGPQAWLALATMLSELLTEGWLQGHALLEALLSVNERHAYRSETPGVEDAALTALTLAKELNDLRGQARAFSLIGFVRISEGKLDLALNAMVKSCDLAERLVSENPTRLDLLRELAAAQSKVGDVCDRQEEFVKAIDAFSKALRTCRALLAHDLGNAIWQRETTVAQQRLGSIMMRANVFDKALETFQDVVATMEQITTKHPENAEWRQELGTAYSDVALAWFTQEHFKEALAAYEQSLAIYRDVAAIDPTNLRWKHDLLITRRNLGSVLAKLGRRDEAAGMLREAEAQAQAEIAAASSAPQWTEDLRRIQAELHDLTVPAPEPRRDDKRV